MKALSLYVHIPFCKSKCHYCDFLSFERHEGDRGRYVDALVGEIEAYGACTKDYEVKSVFIGGGTPSILVSKDLKRILAAIHKYFCLADDAEISIEANPGTLTWEKVLVLKEAGVNRVSLGLQSCENHLLKKLGRIHTWEEFLESYGLIRQAGIDNVNVDLMFGLPNQSLEEVEQDIKKVVELQPEHVSCYGLIIEEDTVFYKLYEKGALSTHDEEVERQMYWRIHDILEAYGYVHYEISNYAKEGKACYHNNVYWIGKPYIGMGLGASSYFEGYRYQNTRHMESYLAMDGDIEAIQEDKQFIDKKMTVEEFMFLGLRLLEGISKRDFVLRFGETIDVYYGPIIATLAGQGLMEEDGDRWRLTRQGVDVSNHVLSHFIFE
ncbi:oxygen-independent coproporphyrinogen III oxidase [Vallitalea pronyensis]|uniref:Heme chaperone HemW n=1 Tax=Vallitalea pronyensis TaxID=1348613 RepID=A0A8J8SHX8_9FIRM|nr:radical SAM family heme chaperone HemW [Vallitalea pronyensis]QUI23877.1 oxygen-independent coproporphyrinogen III oxidase [Vallitalea pronyensis]